MLGIEVDLGRDVSGDINRDRMTLEHAPSGHIYPIDLPRLCGSYGNAVIDRLDVPIKLAVFRREKLARFRLSGRLGKSSLKHLQHDVASNSKIADFSQFRAGGINLPAAHHPLPLGILGAPLSRIRSNIRGVDFRRIIYGPLPLDLLKLGTNRLVILPVDKITARVLVFPIHADQISADLAGIFHMETRP